MRRKDCLRRVTMFALLIFVLAGLLRPAEAEDGFSFAVYEVVNCNKPGAKSMALKGSTQKHCLASKPIVDQTQLKSASSHTSDDGQPQLWLTLTPEGAVVMQKATERIMQEHPGRDGHLAIVVNGQLLHTPRLMNALSDGIVWSGKGLTQKEIDEIKSFLERKTQRNQAKA